MDFCGVHPDLKICLTSSYVYPSVVGGAEKYVYSLAGSLRRLGLEVVIITSEPREKSLQNPFENGVETIFLRPLLSVGANPVTPHLVKTLQQESPTLVHMQAPTLYGDITALSGRLLRIPVICTYHGSITKSSVPDWGLRLYNAIYPAFSLKKCKHVIATTSRYMTFLEQMGLSGRDITVIPVGVEKESIGAQVSQEADKRFGELAHSLRYDPDFTLLFVGALDRYHTYKGIENLLMSFKTVVQSNPRSLLIVVGDGDRKHFYERLAADLGILQNTIFAGWVSKDLLLAMYSRSDLFVLPSSSFSEGFGIVLLEAMSRGCPVLTTSFAGGSEAVREGRSGIVVESADPAALSKAVLRFISDRAFARRCGKNGLKSVSEKYTWDILSERILKIYKRCLCN
jgi:glycosyltransferase involved in cell wall biosynthesis